MGGDDWLSRISDKDLLAEYNFYNGMYGVARECCKSLGLREDFFEEFSGESDWVFTIKMSGVFESAITNLLNSYLKIPQIEENIAALNYSGRNSKIDFCKSMNLISSERIKFLKSLAELRNYYAHGCSSINDSIIVYYSKMNENRKKEWISNFCAHEKIVAKILSSDNNEYIQDRLRFVLFSESIVTLNEIRKKLMSA